MGAFYGSMLIRTENSGEVQKALEAVAQSIGCKFLMGPPVKGWISAFPDNGGQSNEPSIETAKRLHYDVFHLVVHDDDIFSYYFFRGGKMIDQYSSCPDYFNDVSAAEKEQCRGRPDLFGDLIKPASLTKLKALLAAGKEEYVFEEQRMRQFVKLLGLPNSLGNYEHLRSGYREAIKDWKRFVHIPDLSAEKAAQANIKAEKQRLQNQGLLLAETKTSKEQLAAFPATFIRETDSEGDQLLPALRSYQATKVAIHPLRKFAVAIMGGGLGIVELKTRKLVKKLAVNRKMEPIDPFANDSKGTLTYGWIKHILKDPKTREILGVDARSHAAIVQDRTAVEGLPQATQQKIKALLEKVRRGMPGPRETTEHVFDVLFSPNGEQLFIASKGMRVFDWEKVRSANLDTPAPDFSVDAPVDDDEDPNSRPLAYSIQFDPERNLLLSSCLAGVIQYLNVKNGQSGVLLHLPDEVSVFQLVLTSDKNAICCHCAGRPRRENLNNRENFWQVWNYPALCKLAELL